jgi:hypothetical protein
MKKKQKNLKLKKRGVDKKKERDDRQLRKKRKLHYSYKQ